MCLIMTAFTAAVFTVLWLKNRNSAVSNKSIFRAVLMFWAAAFMWSIDGIASVLGGEDFFDLSAEDTILGAIIIVCGLFAYALMRLHETKQSAKA